SSIGTAAHGLTQTYVVGMVQSGQPPIRTTGTAASGRCRLIALHQLQLIQRTTRKCGGEPTEAITTDAPTATEPATTTKETVEAVRTATSGPCGPWGSVHSAICKERWRSTIPWFMSPTSGRTTTQAVRRCSGPTRST